MLPLNRLTDFSLYHRSAPIATNASLAATFLRPEQWMCSSPFTPSQPSSRNEDGHQKVKTQSCPRKTHLRNFMIYIAFFSLVHSYLESFTSSSFFLLMIFSFHTLGVLLKKFLVFSSSLKEIKGA